MKDFDFDELDRAVNSVLTKKQTEDAATTSSPTDTPLSPTPPADTSSSEPTNITSTTDDQADAPTDTQDAPMVSREELPEVPTLDAAPVADETSVSSDASTDTVSVVSPEEVTHDMAEPEHDLMEAPEAEIVKVDTPPHSRGRFMDVVPPSAHTETVNRPMPTRSGIALTPSADFKIDEPPMTDGAAEPATAPTMPNMADEEIEPSPSEQLKANETDGATSDAEVNESTESETTSPTENEAPSGDASTVPTEPSPALEEPITSSQTPFIPDVPVEKRPLNAGSDTAAASTTDTPAAPLETSAPLPKEFGEEIMAVEANETVGSPSSPDDESSPSREASHNDSVAAPAATSIAPQYHAAQDTTDTQAHPVFDASSYHQPLAPTGAKHGASKMVWFVIAGALFLIGSVLGVLYFLYGQQ